MNLLIVDDEIEIVEGMLSGIRWEELYFTNVFYATSADSAKRYFQEYPIDIILCDIEMPGTSGIGLMEWVRAQDWDTECVFLTCHEKFDYARKAISLGSAEYLLKPMMYEEIQTVLRKMTEKVQNKVRNEELRRKGEETISSFTENVDVEEKRSKIVVASVKKYVQKHLAEDLPAEEIARAVFVGTNYLSKIFKKEEGMTLSEYITKERMFYARELLKNPDMTVSYAAISVGYNNYTYFIKVFKKEYGVTPSEYHREWVKKNKRSDK